MEDIYLHKIYHFRSYLFKCEDEKINYMRLKVIACDVLNREISYLSSLSNCYVDVTFLHQGLHCTPDKLKIMLQKEIDIANNGFPYNHFELYPEYDYIVLGYGLCSNGIIGLSSKKLSLVVPRAHDCITLLLGSKSKYDELFSLNPGTYWYSRGWIECSIQPGEERYINTLNQYVERYGEENAEYLMNMEQGWFSKYNKAAFINWKCLGNTEYYKSYTKKCAQYLKWDYTELNGDFLLMEKILNGYFEDGDVQVIPAGKTITLSHNENIINYE